MDFECAGAQKIFVMIEFLFPFVGPFSSISCVKSI
uniref:Uncharacterized protein n=1 Tax=Arundo donax TaxID=35708 RepID=A0A0A9H8W5_ARUDO